MKSFFFGTGASGGGRAVRRSEERVNSTLDTLTLLLPGYNSRAKFHRRPEEKFRARRLYARRLRVPSQYVLLRDSARIGGDPAKALLRRHARTTPSRLHIRSRRARPFRLFAKATRPNSGPRAPR